MKIIVGLGNPGKEYENTRHNIGFMILDNYAKEKGIQITKSKFGGLYGEFIKNNEKVILLKPQRYINLSGEVIKKHIEFYKIPIEDIFIIHDDLDTELGKYKIKPDGSSAGHNGLKNIEANIGTQNYKRLKIGISNNKFIDAKDYVLGKISPDEKEMLNSVIDVSVNIINDYLELGFNQLMNKYNHK